jgi:hypothetical protein
MKCQELIEQRKPYREHVTFDLYFCHDTPLTAGVRPGGH